MLDMSGNLFTTFPSSLNGFSHQEQPEPNPNPKTNPTNPASKKRRNQPGNPDPDAEVIALSPKTLMATNRFICEICNKGFQRDQNLQLHRRGHNLPWKLKQRSKQDVVKKKVYICPEKTCVHHDASRALGDLTGVKKHFSRKHGEKKWKCDKCSKKYAVQSDWKAHSKTCGTREYKCDCGTLFSRKDSFITHRAFCDALAEESSRITSIAATSLNFTNEHVNQSMGNHQLNLMNHGFSSGIPQISSDFVGDQLKPKLSLWLDQPNSQLTDNSANSNIYIPSSTAGLHDVMNIPQMASSDVLGYHSLLPLTNNQTSQDDGTNKNATVLSEDINSMFSNSQQNQSKSFYSMSATALLQKAAEMGSTKSTPSFFTNSFGLMSSSNMASSTSSSLTNNNLDHQSIMISGQESQQGPLTFGLTGVDHSMTRDFLGLAGDGGRPFSPHELATLASMSSAMGFGHFGRNQ